MKKEIPFRNRNQTGWWIASIVMRFEYYDEDKDDLKRECLVWDNLILVEAEDREDAFVKSNKLGIAGENEAWETDTGRKGKWKFEGLSGLLPMYDEFAHGAELLWNEYDGISVEKAKSMVLPKSELECFEDE